MINEVEFKLKKKNKGDKLAYIRMYVNVSGKAVYKSLGLDPINPKDWDDRRQRIKSSHTKAEMLNKVLEEKEKEVKKKGNDPRLLNDDKKSLVDYIRTLVIPKTTNMGSKMKFDNVLSTLIQFNNATYGDLDIKFKDINIDFIEDYFVWLRKDFVRPDGSIRKAATRNGAMKKVKIFQSLVNKAVKKDYYYYHRNPFSIFEYKFEPTAVQILTKKELESLINTKVVDTIRADRNLGQQLTRKQKVVQFTLSDVRHWFLFQLFAQGIRVSDLMTLRWNDMKFENKQIRIKKRMIKTKGLIDILVNDRLFEILYKYVKSAYNKHIGECKEVDKLTDEILMRKQFGGGLYLGTGSVPLKGQAMKEQFDQLMKKRRGKLKLMIEELSNNEKTKTLFVFPLLDDKYFIDINADNDFSLINRKQYDKFTGRRAYYNRLLKLVAAQCGIKKKLTSHIARHSYTSLMLELGEDVNLFDLMSSLGHKHLTTTQTYIQKFTTRKVDHLNRVLVNKLNVNWDNQE